MRTDQYPKPFWRKQTNCYYVQFRGKQHRLSADKDEAYRLYHELMSRPPEATDAPKPITFAVEIIDAFLDWVQKNKAARTFDSYREMIQVFVDSIPATLDVAALKPYHVTRAMDSRSDTWGNNTKHDFVTTVQRAFNWAEKQGLIDRSPVRNVEKPAREARELAISPAEYAEIITAVKEPNFRDLVELAWETGSRPQELVKIDAAYLDAESSRIVFPPRQTKGKKYHRVIYLGTERAREIVARLAAARPTGVLLRNSEGAAWNKNSINCAIRRVRMTLGLRLLGEVEPIPRFRKWEVPEGELAEARRAHRELLAKRRKDLGRKAIELSKKYHLGALRKGFCTEALKNGVDTLTVAHLMGHANGAMVTRIYGKVQQDPAHMLESARRAKERR